MKPTSTTRDPLAVIIESVLRRVRQSSGYADTADQIAVALRERVPETAEEIAQLEYLNRLCNTLRLERDAARLQLRAPRTYSHKRGSVQ